jgi:hypothetical protein
MTDRNGEFLSVGNQVRCLVRSQALLGREGRVVELREDDTPRGGHVVVRFNDDHVWVRPSIIQAYNVRRIGGIGA